MEDAKPVLTPPLVHLFRSFMRQCMRLMDEAETVDGSRQAPRLNHKVSVQCHCMRQCMRLMDVPVHVPVHATDG